MSAINLPLHSINEALSEKLGRKFKGKVQQGLGGGCISQTCILHDEHDSFFIKWGGLSQKILFEGEFNSLRVWGNQTFLKAPKPFSLLTMDSACVLVLEKLDLVSSGNFSDMGRHLAKVHQTCTSPWFGLEFDNTIGSTPQRNSREKDWPTFFVKHRLAFQLQLAEQNGFSFREAESFLSRARSILDQHSTTASLLHGDLWSGNAGFLSSGEPIVYDPAVYYGDPEADIAMTRLFGGFPGSFYKAYHEVIPEDQGASLRYELYNTYHILNHLNLFGGSYLGQAKMMMRDIIAAGF